MVNVTEIDFAMKMRNNMERQQDIGSFMHRPHWLNEYIEAIQHQIAKQEKRNG